MWCPHNLGLGHAVVDLLMAVPFVTSGLILLKSRLKKKVVNCHTDTKAPEGAGTATFINNKKAK